MQETVTQNRLAFSVSEVSEQTTLSKAFIRNEIRDGKLKIRRIGRRVLVLVDDLKIYLNEYGTEDENN